MMIFLLSLAGSSAVGRFLWEVYLFAAALSNRCAESGLAVAGDSGDRDECGVVYYYLKVLKQIYVVNPPKGNERSKSSHFWSGSAAGAGHSGDRVGLLPGSAGRAIAELSRTAGALSANALG